MSCSKRFSYLCAFVFSVLASILLSTIITSGDVFATELCSYTFTSTVNSQQYCTDYLSDIKYVLIDFGVDSSVHSLSATYNTYNVSNIGGRSSYIWEYSNLPYNYIQSISGATSEYPVVFSFYDSFPSNCPAVPSGTLSITENGTYDVTNYSSAEVDVPPIMGDYHDDLVNIKQAIYTGCAVLLVLYFFYCIYRMIIKGVKR